MRTCRNDVRLALYASGDLHGWQRFRISQHLRNCSDCRQELARLQRTSALVADSLKKQSSPEFGDDLWPAIRVQILATTQAPPARATTRWRYVLQHAAAAALAVAIFWLLSYFENRAAQKITTLTRAENNAPVPKAVESYPILSNLKMPNVEVMTFRTEDPNITIVWFFKKS